MDKSYLKLTTLCLFIFFTLPIPTIAEDTHTESPIQVVEGISLQSLAWTYGLLILLALISVYFLWKRGNLRLVNGSEKKLKICENRVIGPKQCLLVVEYEGEKMLLGVSPGIIQHLCFLGMQTENLPENTPFETLMQVEGVKHHLEGHKPRSS